MGGVIPKAVWSGVFVVFGVELHCSVLDDGRRIIDAEDVAKLFAAIDAEDVAKLFAAMEDDAQPTEAEVEALDAFMRWQGGR
jgi:hypothetical protein